jgi:ATP-binding cassette subfamily B protein
MTVLGEYVARDLRSELYEHLQGLSLSFFARKRTGSLITRVSADTDRLWEFLALGVVDVSLAAVTMVGLAGVLIHLDWRLGLVMTLPVPLLCWAIARHGRRMNELFLRAWRKWSSVTDLLSDTIPGMRVVKAFNQEDREKRRFGARNHDVVAEFNRIHGVWTSFWPTLLLAIHGLVLAVWLLALPRLLGDGAASGPALSAGTFVSFLLYMTMFVHPIEVIGQMARVMNRATSSAHRVFEVLDTQPEIVDRPDPVRLEPVRGEVRFENVSFGYDGVRQIIKGVSFTVREGEMIGLVGPSGGGKTTIVNLIARFYDVTSGAVCIDGVDLRELDTGAYRRQVGMVLQDPYLFHGTLLENIRYGLPEAAVEQVVEAACTANAHDFICKTTHGYDTLVGERGQTLSGGERQRISIARAILHDPRILILDEATSSVDTETEWKIQEALERLVRGRTVFAIAHRLSTLKRADRLLVVEDGRIAESGTHQELLARPGGTYAKLHALQLQLHEGDRS